jgi:ABC-2 type transport system permease protein
VTDDRAFISTGSMFPTLVGVKIRTARNRVVQAVREAPIRISAGVLLTGLVWIGLYGLFRAVFLQLHRTPLEATVAIPLVFNFFFVAMLVLLTLSNAIIAYAALFGKEECPYLLTLPLTPLDVVSLKYLESLLLASWSLVLLGMPLMLAMADQARGVGFYALFIAFFLAFIPIPGALGTLLAWGAARFFPRSAVRAVAIGAGILVAAALVWAMRALQLGTHASEVWLRSFLSRMSFVEATFLPNRWVATGIDQALHGQGSDALLYLGVTIANALFLSWLAVMVVSAHFDSAYDRVSSGRAGGRRVASQPAGDVAGLIFFYLPMPLRLVAAKDLRTFFRDPLQWSQLAILFGLLALYLTNMPNLRLEISSPGWALMVPFLNLCALSLILATFTCRFVFPLVSLEGQQLWLMGVLPVPRGQILLAKFAFSITVTVAVAVSALALAAFMLEQDTVWVMIHLVIIISICFGLCGFSVGLGARLPMFKQTNAARIANGAGGTINLLASVVLIAVVLTGVGIATWGSRVPSGVGVPNTRALLWCTGSVAFALAAGIAALRLGERHFNRVEM